MTYLLELKDLFNNKCIKIIFLLLYYIHLERMPKKIEFLIE